MDRCTGSSAAQSEYVRTVGDVVEDQLSALQIGLRMAVERYRGRREVGEKLSVAASGSSFDVGGIGLTGSHVERGLRGPESILDSVDPVDARSQLQRQVGSTAGLSFTHYGGAVRRGPNFHGEQSNGRSGPVSGERVLVEKQRAAIAATDQYRADRNADPRSEFARLLPQVWARIGTQVGMQAPTRAWAQAPLRAWAQLSVESAAEGAGGTTGGGRKDLLFPAWIGSSNFLVKSPDG